MQEDFKKEALANDQNDPLKDQRQNFHIPFVNGKESIYFCGNSLGLQPKSARPETEKVFSNWQKLAVEGHFEGKDPWIDYHKRFNKPLAAIVGAKESEVVAMNNLTVNLHLGLVSFYRPSDKKHKIMMEGHAFPSDQYAVESQVSFHGYNPDNAIIELMPSKNEELLKTEDILQKLSDHADETALLLLGGLQYYTGQLFELEKICLFAKEKGIRVGLDLAHAAGNVPLQLHNWDIDFAVWCSYKYLNSGPGAVSGMFIHEKHHKDLTIPRFAGWWGHDEQERFLMKKGFSPIKNADGWQLSNGSILNMASHFASLQIFDAVGMAAIRKKSMAMTAYLEKLMKTFDFIKIITPKDPHQRGSQLSLYFEKNGKEIFRHIQDQGVIADWREPNVIRIAPAPLYNTFEEIFNFYYIIKSYNAK